MRVNVHPKRRRCYYVGGVLARFITACFVVYLIVAAVRTFL